MMRGIVLAIIVVVAAVGMQAEGFAAFSEEQHHQELFQDLMDAPNAKEYADHFATNFFAPDRQARAEMAAAESANADFGSLLGTTKLKKGTKARKAAIVRAMSKKGKAIKKAKVVKKVVVKKVVKKVARRGKSRKGKLAGKGKGKLAGKAHRTRPDPKFVTQEELDRRSIAKKSALNDRMVRAQITESVDRGDIDDLAITKKARAAVNHMFLESKTKCRALKSTVYTKCAQIFCNKGKAKLCLDKHDHKTCKAEAKERVFKEKDTKANIMMARLHSVKLERKEKAHFALIHQASYIKKHKELSIKAKEVGVKAKAKERKVKAADAASERWIKDTVKQTSHSSATAAIDDSGASGGGELLQEKEAHPVGGILRALRKKFRKGKASAKVAHAQALRRIKLLSSKKCRAGKNAAYSDCSAITSDSFTTCRGLAQAADAKYRGVVAFMKSNRQSLRHVDVQRMSTKAKRQLTSAILKRLAHQALASKAAKKALFKYRSDKAHLALAAHRAGKSINDATDKNKASSITKVDAKAAAKAAGKSKGKAKAKLLKKAAVAKGIAKDAKAVAAKANVVVSAKKKIVKKLAKKAISAGYKLKAAAIKAVKDVKKGAKVMSLYEMEASLFDQALDKPEKDLYDQEEDLFQEVTEQDDYTRQDSRRLSLYDEQAADFDSMLH